jgi:hypothetical protein
MTDATEAPLSETIRYEIEQAQSKVHDAYRQKLLAFRVPLDSILQCVGKETYKLPNKKGAEFGFVLASYASELIAVEAERYPSDPNLKTWLGNRYVKIHNIVMSKLENIENIRYHASKTEMSIVLMDALMEYGQKRLELRERAAKRETASIGATPSSPSTKNQLSEARKAFVMPCLAEKGLTRSRWADKTGVDPSVVYDYLNGKSHPRPENRKALAEALGLRANDLPE